MPSSTVSQTKFNCTPSQLELYKTAASGYKAPFELPKQLPIPTVFPLPAVLHVDGCRQGHVSVYIYIYIYIVGGRG